jgi:uncharacterized protein (TIGR03437 family)
MCLSNTRQRAIAWIAIALSISGGIQIGQGQALRADWRRIGNSAMDLSLAAVATGPVDRVWYSDDGARLYAQTASGIVYATDDLEKWAPAPDSIVPPRPADLRAPRTPEPGARLRAQTRSSAKLYAFGLYVYRSDDGGVSWNNLTAYRNTSLIGGDINDAAVSPRNPDEIVVAAGSGVWRSVDGGLSWSGENESLPNLPVRRIVATPSNTRGVVIEVSEPSGAGIFEWAPGEKQAWRVSNDPEAVRDEELRRSLSATLHAPITAAVQAGDYIYAGSSDGQLWASNDRGKSWRANPDQAVTPVARITVDARDPRLALAALGSRPAGSPATARAPHVLLTTNGGAFWDDLTANLPDSGVFGIAADRASGAIYAATDRGLLMTIADLNNPAPPTPWFVAGAGLPEGRIADVRLDAAGNQLYAAVDGYGIYASPAPHRTRAPRIVSAADFSERAAAPGALLTILGANVREARAGSLPAPVLAATDFKSEIQVPFEARGASLSLAIEAGNGAVTLGVPLQSTSPAIFVDRDGSPVALDADSGILLDAMNPAHSNSRIQLLATGLGRVNPDWQTGLAAPLENPPQVIAPVRVYLDRTPVEVTRAVLAPGYVGFYLIEIQVPKLVNYGPAELYIDVNGQPSNRVRVYIKP